MRHLRVITELPVAALVFVARAYQLTISPLLGPKCRFSPTCSEYFVQSVRKFGLVVGCYRAAIRIVKCHPWHRGGYDPP